MNTHSTRPRPTRRWPLLVLALPAAVSIWSGWVGLGQMAGFGLVHPLPGIADGFTLNSAITLPVGVEAYSAYALGSWLATHPMPAAARRFAAWSSLAALGLGLIGQV
ncbi:MAG TPA: ABC transporter permease, partial [Pseudonocardiaceae bacterium]|nr:ABC transporter permease [Pseudonocardiaceae bacterium]